MIEKKKKGHLASGFCTTHIFLVLATIGHIYVTLRTLVPYLHGSLLGELTPRREEFLEAIPTLGGLEIMYLCREVSANDMNVSFCAQTRGTPNLPFC